MTEQKKMQSSDCKYRNPYSGRCNTNGYKCHRDYQFGYDCYRCFDTI